MSQLPKLPWPLCRFVASGGATTTPTPRATVAAAGGPAAATSPAEAPVEMSVVEDRLRVEGPQLAAVLTAVETHVGVDVELVRCERTIKGGLRGFFGREHFIVEARPQGATPVAAPASATPAPATPAPATPAPATGPAVAAALAVEDPAPVLAVGDPAAAHVAPAATDPTRSAAGSGTSSLDGLTFAETLAQALADLDAQAADEPRVAEPRVADTAHLVEPAEPSAPARPRGLQPPRPRDEPIAAVAPVSDDAVVEAPQSDGRSVADLLLELLAERADVLDLRDVDHGALDRIADLIAPEPAAPAPPSPSAPEADTPIDTVRATAFEPRFDANIQIPTPDATLAPLVEGFPEPTLAPLLEQLLRAAAPPVAQTIAQTTVEPVATPLQLVGEPTTVGERRPSFAEVVGGVQRPTGPASSSADLTVAAPTMPFDDVVAAVRRLAGPVPSLPERGIVAVVGDDEVAVRTAELLARQVGDEPGDVVVLSSSPVDDRPSWMRLDSADAAAARRDRWARRDSLTFVAVVLDPGPEGVEWGCRALDALAPSQTRVAVAGSCHAADVERLLRSLAPVDTIDLATPTEVIASASYLDLDVPVSTIDGFAATYESWARWLQATAPAATRPRRRPTSSAAPPPPPPPAPPAPALAAPAPALAPPDPQVARARPTTLTPAALAPQGVTGTPALDPVPVAATADRGRDRRADAFPMRAPAGLALLERPLAVDHGGGGPDPGLVALLADLTRSGSARERSARGPSARGPSSRGRSARGPSTVEISPSTSPRGLSAGRDAPIRGPADHSGRPRVLRDRAPNTHAHPSRAERRRAAELLTAVDGRPPARRTISSPTFPVVEPTRRAHHAPEHRTDP